MENTTIIELEIKDHEDLVYPFVWINDEQENVTIKITIIGDNSSVLLCGLFLGSKGKHITFTTDVLHIGRHTKSRTMIRGVFFDNAVLHNDSVIRIQKGAKHTDAFFQSKILLFDDAKGRSVPSLEIDENEVKAGHGSTIGRFDESEMFYLRSRGLSEKEAEALLVLGFFDPILQLVPTTIRTEAKKKMSKFLH